MNVLGISAYYHDSAACLITDGKIVAAAQEERFSRKKHDDRFPVRAVAYCLKEGGITIDEVDYVAFYEKPFLKFERILETYLSFAPQGVVSFLTSMPVWLKKKLWMKNTIAQALGSRVSILFPEHHQSHAASAFFASPFKRAAVLTLDGVGEFATASYGVGNKNKLTLLAQLNFPHSLGLLYSAFTYYLGFKVNSGEYKVMGLAPYGRPVYRELIFKELVEMKEDGSIHLNMRHFNYATGLTMTAGSFEALFSEPRRKAESLLTQKHMDIAASLQEVTNTIVLTMARHIQKETGERNLVLAGGVALNCVANGELLRSGIFDNIWVQPASGDAGGALGAALSVYYQYLGNERTTDDVHDAMAGAYLGPQYPDDDIRHYLQTHEIPSTELQEDELPERIASLLNEQKVIGWFEGRMEFRPRALGARSILGDARSPHMQQQMNLKIKFRESFRPFAPAVLKERAADFFEITTESPYMLITAKVNDNRRLAMTDAEQKLFGIEKLNVVRSDIPAVTHVDYSARLQTVDKETNPRFHALLSTLDTRYGCPVVINTSFNVRGEPIVCTPEDAYRCFMRTGIDYLLLGRHLIDKRAQTSLEKDTDWRAEFEPD